MNPCYLIFLSIIYLALRLLEIYDVRGTLWRNNRKGLLKLKYWLNKHTFWLGVWMRAGFINQNLYTSIESPAVKGWVKVNLDLSELISLPKGNHQQT